MWRTTCESTVDTCLGTDQARTRRSTTILITKYGLPFYFGGTGLLIVVGVSLDTVSQIEGHLLTQHYDGLMDAKTGRSRRGRRRPLGTL